MTSYFRRFVETTSSHGVHLNETIDVSDEVQFIVCCRVADEETQTTAKHYVYGLKVGVCATARAIFGKLNHFIEDKTVCIGRSVSHLLAMGKQLCKFLLMELS